MRIYLVGPMGAGKSTIGRLLAEELGCSFVDVDREIEARAGVDIPWIFDQEGEAGFRDREQAVLRAVSEAGGGVIATGGGAVIREDNRRLMQQGRVVYLQTTVAEQLRRVGRDRRRPLLQQEDPAAVLKRLMAEREPLYQAVAHHVVDTDGRAPRSVARELAGALRRDRSSSRH